MIRLAALAAVLLAAPTAWAGIVPREPGAKIRLIVAGVVDGRPRVGLEIVLEDGWKTYWRTPGDAGIPPSIEAGGSRGVTLEAVRFPAPERFDEADSHSIGYTRTVILPLDVTLADPNVAGDLDLHVQIGLCHDICVPMETGLSARIDPRAPVDPALAARITAARDLVPSTTRRADAPTITRVTRAEGPAPQIVTVEVALPPGAAADTDLLVEGPDDRWALPLPTRIDAAPGRETWHFSLDGAPKAASLDGAALRFTLRAGTAAAEEIVHLDAATTAP